MTTFDLVVACLKSWWLVAFAVLAALTFAAPQAVIVFAWIGLSLAYGAHLEKTIRRFRQQESD